MTRKELQLQFYKEKGIECVNSQGEPDIDYVKWLEDKVLEQAKALRQPTFSGSYYSCMDCEWEGEITQCDFDTEYDEFKGIDRKYPICPKCGGGLDC